MFRSLLITLLFFTAGIVQAQQELTFNSSTKFFVDGTSTLHDWTIESNKITGKLVADESTGAVKSVTLSLPVESLESGKSGMDSRVYSAFDSKKNPTISFQSTNVTMAADGKSGVAKGKLTMAGATRDIDVPFTVDSSSGDWKFIGAVDMLMTTFDMKPPTAMMGTVRAGDAVKVRFEVVTRKPAVAMAQ